MLKAYPPFNDFLSASVCLGLVFALGFISAFDIIFNFPIGIFSTLCGLSTILVVIGIYQLLFRVNNVKISHSVWLFLALLPATFFAAFPELIAHTMGSSVFDTDTLRFFNAWYVLLAAAISFAWAYFDTCVQIRRCRELNTNYLSLMTLDVFLSDHSFSSKDKTRGMHTLCILLAFGGICMLGAFFSLTNFFGTQDLKSIVARIAVMFPAGFIFGSLFVFLGQATCVIKLEKASGRQFELRDFDQRLKWRHDYVKYHLPAPIRKLNLRLFNQHVEAYERLQNKVKSSRT